MLKAILHGKAGSSQRKAQKGEPDPVKMEMGKAILQAQVYRPLQASGRSFDEEWAQAHSGRAAPTQRMQKVSENMQAIEFEWSLAEVLVDPKCIVSALRKDIE